MALKLERGLPPPKYGSGWWKLPPKPLPDLYDKRFNLSILAVGHESNVGRTYALWGTGRVSLFGPENKGIASLLASKGRGATAYYNKHIVTRTDFADYDIPEPPNPARWYYIHWREVAGRDFVDIIRALRDAQLPKRKGRLLLEGDDPWLR